MSRFRPTSFEEAKEVANSRSTRPQKPLSRKKPLIPLYQGGSGLQGGNLAKNRGRLGAGKKTRAWDSARAKIKIRFEAVGITTCELQNVLPHDCWHDNGLGFAHDAKRRKLSAEDLTRVILICNVAHDTIEVWPPEKMKAIVNETIQRRRTQP
jgi:hypothetical protein